MRRRDFIALFGGAVAVWPLAARAQQAGRLPTIGYLGSSTPTGTPYYAAFVQRLHELGWIEGRTVAIEYRWAEGRNDRLPELARDLVRRQVSVIVATGAAHRPWRPKPRPRKYQSCFQPPPTRGIATGPVERKFCSDDRSHLSRPQLFLM